MMWKKKRQLDASHMRFFRPLVGVTRRDRLLNEEIRNRLKTINIVNDIRSYQLNWKQHVDRMGKTDSLRSYLIINQQEREI
jgi:hypothetical protein